MQINYSNLRIPLIISVISISGIATALLLNTPEPSSNEAFLIEPKARIKTIEQTNVDSALKTTNLALTLRGVLATNAEDPTQGYAQIESEDKEDIFAVNDNIFGLAILKEIYHNRVIVLHQKKRFTLLLSNDFKKSAHYLDEQLIQQKKIASDFRNLLFKRRGMDLIKLFGFDTVYRNGGFYGFAINVLGKDGQRMIDTFGIKNNDIIVAVNNDHFSENIQAVNNLTQLKDATQANIEIDRNGVSLFFDIHFEENASENTTNSKQELTKNF